jgi:hypothetical protein
MAKLYELTGDIKALESMDLDAETLADSLEGISGEFEEKAKGILAFTENMNGDIEALDSQIKRLTERKKVLTNRKNNLRAYLLHNMEASGITKIECPLFTASLRKGIEVVDVQDSESIPDEYIEIQVTEKVDKAALKRDIKAGKEINGVSLKRNPTTITIK